MNSTQCSWDYLEGLIFSSRGCISFTITKDERFDYKPDILMHLHETQSEYCMEVCNFVKLQPLTKGRWNPWWSNIHKLTWPKLCFRTRRTWNNLKHWNVIFCWYLYSTVYLVSGDLIPVPCGITMQVSPQRIGGVEGCARLLPEGSIEVYIHLSFDFILLELSSI